jgi:hypothetical protein
MKNMGFSKVFSNQYITFEYQKWTEKFPQGKIAQLIGSVDSLDHFYEYQLYCKKLNFSINKFKKDTSIALQKACVNPSFFDDLNKTNRIEDRTISHKVFSMDGESTQDYDDAFSIQVEGQGQGTVEGQGKGEGENASSSSSTESMQDHLHNMMGGKLGEIAKEIAEETANNFNIDMNNPTDINGILSGLLKNPAKLMNMVKDIGGKLDEKMKSGDINEGDLFNEASDIMQKMKNIPGMDNIQSMLGKMGMPMPPNMGAGAGQGSGKNTRVDENAMNRQLQMMKTRERMRKNVEVKAAQQQQQMAQSLLLGSTSVPAYNDEELISMFSEKSVERNAPSSSSSEKKAKKEKKKK